jgi:2-methylcitrate dehydratase
MKLNPDQLSHAIGIALNDHIPMAQTRVGALSDWKGLAAAEAGRNAVSRSAAGASGLTGPAPIFEGSSGFFAQVSGPAHVDVESFGRRGIQFRLHKCNLKPYSAVIYADRHRRRN